MVQVRSLLICCFVCLGGYSSGCKKSVKPRPSVRTAQRILHDKRQVPKKRASMPSAGKTIQLDPKMEQLIRPFRERLQKSMHRIIGQNPRALVRRRPNSGLGNLIADVALATLPKKLRIEALALNFGGLRNDLAAGPVTRGQIFEILPFENRIVWAKIKGSLLQKIADTIAARSGEPIAGMTFSIRKNKAVDVKIRTKRIRASAMYRFATIDYLARTGYLKPLLKNVRLNRTGLLLRNLALRGLRRPGYFKRARADQRIVQQKDTP